MKPDLRRARALLFFKDFAHWVRSSCVGLTVAGYAAARYLRERGIDATAQAVRHNVDLVNCIHRFNEAGPGHEKKPVTHVVISAPWLSAWDLKSLARAFPDISFAVLSHSNVGFLQADPGGVKLFRQYAALARERPNLRVGGNCGKFTNWFRLAYGEPCVLLPNLYPFRRVRGKLWNRRTPLRVGAFGAVRSEKNFMTAAGAAVALRRLLDAPVELHMSSGGEGCRHYTGPAIREMAAGLDRFTLVWREWEHWDRFIETVSEMDVLLQVSYTESFNMITADGISVGVPSVVSPAIGWCPESWRADPDSAVDVAQRARWLATADQGYAGSDALEKHNELSLHFWLDWLQDGDR